MKGKQKKRGVKERRERGGKNLREEGVGVKERTRVVGWSRLVEGTRKMLLCRVSFVGTLARSSCTISMQKFEFGEMYIVGRPTSFFPYKL